MYIYIPLFTINTNCNAVFTENIALQPPVSVCCKEEERQTMSGACAEVVDGYMKSLLCSILLSSKAITVQMLVK